MDQAQLPTANRIPNQPKLETGRFGKLLHLVIPKRVACALPCEARVTNGDISALPIIWVSKAVRLLTPLLNLSWCGAAGGVDEMGVLPGATVGGTDDDGGAETGAVVVLGAGACAHA
ncbi:hypothetical protein AXG93_2189s1060 [Marchantia polymorpha subsp. ruderalis]|uniref:Uncharacterized protein n=1 Tax=Marchantia polymorpha subsp. ruderalis TaxID=1480154 RepID=A0A176WT68_MARPO|nr:hypothetical protein AXG93_2189s1060 [Marchantia polymorpha subsp. ruderalis]